MTGVLVVFRKGSIGNISLAFLDYETYPSAIPKYNGYRPYQQIPFQFSLHVIESPNGESVHYDFIYTDQECPDQYFSEALKKHIPSKGSIVVWSQKFEKGINRQLGEHLPNFKDFIRRMKHARLLNKTKKGPLQERPFNSAIG